MTAARFLPAEGIHNLRDYGGWRGADGRAVRRGLLFRSGQHVAASDADLALLGGLALRTVIDLRGPSERARHPCRRVAGWDGAVIAHAEETTSSPPHLDIDAATTTADYARARMLAVYGRMPRNPAMRVMFARYLRALAERDGASLVHCFAGKDRTGMAATLLLHILGVGADEVRAEFLLTNAAPTMAVLAAQSVPIIEARLGRTLDAAAIRALLEVDADYLARFLAVAAEDFGSLDGWLAGAIGVDEALRSALRARYLA